jgi:peptide chain release factor 2
VCFFKPLTKPVLHEIARREIDNLFQREGITRRGLVIEMDEEVVERVVERGYSPKFGARHLKRQIERSIAYPLARAIIQQPTRAGDLARVYVKGDRIHAALIPDEAERAILEAGIELETEDLSRRFTVEEMRNAVDELFARIERIESFHEMDATRTRMNDLITEMSAPTFWDDPQAAEAKLAVLGDLTRKVDVCEGLRRAAEDLESALELIVEEGARQLIGDAARRYRYLLRELPRVELDLLLTGPWDTHDAFLTVSVAPEDTEAAEWAEGLARMYLGWAGHRRYEATVLDETRDDAGHLQSFTVAIRGHGAFGLLKGESGAHRRLQHREEGGRQVLHARVEVIPDIGVDELGEITPGDLELQSQAISGQGEFIRRLRSHAQAVHLPSETVVSLTNDRTRDDNSELCRHLLQARLTFEARVPERPAPSPLEPFWGAVVRTYSVYKDQFVKDTRTGVTETHIRRVLEGHIDTFLEAYLRALAAGEKEG